MDKFESLMVALGCLATSMIWAAGAVSAVEHKHRDLVTISLILSLVWLCLAVISVWHWASS